MTEDTNGEKTYFHETLEDYVRTRERQKKADEFRTAAAINLEQDRVYSAGILQEAAKETGDETKFNREIQSLLQSSDPNDHYSIVQAGAKKSFIRVNRALNENLEKLVQTSPDELIESFKNSFPGIKPKEKLSGKYAEAVKLHNELYEMNQNLSQFSKDNENADPKKRKEIIEKMLEKSDEYYDNAYGSNKEAKKDNEDLIKALKEMSRRHPEMAIQRYESDFKEKLEKFNSLVEGNVKEYLRSGIDEDTLRELYLQNFVNNYKALEQNRQRQKEQLDMERD